MAHYAIIDENNLVTNVIVADDEYIENLENKNNYIKTSYNTLHGQHTLGGTPLRKNFAGIGMYYDPERDAFISMKPYPSWVLDEFTCTWISPIEKPQELEGKFLFWDEPTRSWIYTDIPDEESIKAQVQTYLQNLGING
jgi:hypothetical protein